MDKINWSNYTYDDFELFCNALFMFEFGKKYVPFSASGRDGGIDGFFSGTYMKQTGNWRFQFKFYKSARSEGVSSLKSQLKKEAEKIADENFFLLATNVELLPQEITLLSEVFNNQMLLNQKNCKALIWDGAKLYNLLIQYPILMLWLNDGFKTAQLKTYQTVFGEQLRESGFRRIRPTKCMLRTYNPAFSFA
ncbi:MAG TPA: hypothetical protein VF270_12915 [Ignavibacteriaceae bacterium]